MIIPKRDYEPILLQLATVYLLFETSIKVILKDGLEEYQARYGVEDKWPNIILTLVTHYYDTDLSAYMGY